jgi:hypothetical protein
MQGCYYQISTDVDLRGIMPDRRCDLLAILLLAWKTIIVLFTVATSIFSLLAAIDAHSAKCAEVVSLGIYRTGISGLYRVSSYQRGRSRRVHLFGY